jgi:hypothetical protein
MDQRTEPKEEEEAIEITGHEPDLFLPESTTHIPTKHLKRGLLSCRCN